MGVVVLGLVWQVFVEGVQLRLQSCVLYEKMS